MNCNPILDLLINLLGLHELNNMLIEISDDFTNTEFCYVDQGVITLDSDG